MILLRLLGLLLATGFCGSASLALRRRLALESGSVGIVVFLLFFTTLQSVIVLVAGLTGALSFWPLTLLTALGWGLLQLGAPHLVIRIHPPADRLAWVIAVAAAAEILSLLIKTLLLQPYTGDALQYHLPKIAQWIQSGRFVWGINQDPRVWFSAGFELIETWWVVFLHHDALIELGGVQMALIAAAAVYALAETIDARPGLAGVVFLFIPAVILQATSCGNDLAVAALILAGYALVASRAPRPIQALPLCLVAGVKATGAFAALGVIAFAFYYARPPKLPRWAAASLGVAGLLLGGFWYVRNLIVAGHPLYPFYGSKGEFTWTPQQAGIDLESLQATLQVLPRRLLDPQPFQSLSRNTSSWGWALLPLGMPALLLALREDRRYRRLAACFVLGGCTTLACVWPDDSNLRFVLWFPALFALAVARQKAPLWITAALLACVVNFAATVVPYELRYSRHIQPPAALPPHEPVACVFTQAVSSYRLYNPDFSRRVVYPRSLEELRRSGAKFVFLYEPPEWTEPIRDWPSIGGSFYEVR